MNSELNVFDALSEEDEGEDEDDDLLRRTGNLVASSDRLPAGVLKVSPGPGPPHHPITSQQAWLLSHVTSVLR